MQPQADEQLDEAPAPKPSLAEQLAAEQQTIAAGTTQACGHSCWCHSEQPCIRLPHPDRDGDRVPHVARAADGTLTQWAGPCPPVGADGQPMTQEQALQAAIDARTAHTEAWLASLDLDQVAAALAGPLAARTTGIT